jgi:Txe/YoeB family toxin of Txe-Axe toxin-antitoxin module
MYSHIELEKALSNKKTILKSYPKGVQNKLLRLINDILTTPRNKVAIGKPEELKHTDIEKWSRELTEKDRIVYTIEPGINHNMPNIDEVVIFHQYLGHYDDK